MADDDPIKKLLLQTGWSYAEVLKKLEAYKDHCASDSESKTCDKELNKESESQNECNIQLSANNNGSANEERVTLEKNNIKDAETKSDEETLTNSEKKETAEIEVTKSYEEEEETVSDIKKCVKHDDTKDTDIDFKNDEQKSKNTEYVTECSEIDSASKAKLEKSIETPGSEESKDDELQNIIQRLEKFIEENAESDNEESYTEMYSNKSEYENSKRGGSKTTCSDKKVNGNVEEQKRSSNESDKEELEKITEFKYHNEETPKFTDNTEVIIKENHVEESLQNETEKSVEITEITNIEKLKVPNSEPENHIKENSIVCNAESEIHNEETVQEIIKNDLEVNNIVKISDLEQKTECNLETNTVEEGSWKKVNENNLKAKQHDTEITNLMSELENFTNGKEIVLRSREISIVNKLIEPNVEMENLKSEIRREKTLGPTDSSSSLEDKLENSIQNKIEENIEDLKNTRKESTSPNYSEKSVHKPNSEPLNEDIEPLNEDIEQDESSKNVETDSETNSGTTPTKQIISEDLLVTVHTIARTSSDRRIQSKNLNRNLSSIRLRLLRKSKNTLNRQIKKKSENNAKIVETEDIRSKLKEQLELLRTKRKTTREIPLITSKPSCSLKFSKRNTNRLNNITNILSRKLSCDEIKVPDKSENDLEVQESESRILNDKPDIYESSKISEDSVILSDETDLMILNVIGGYKSPTSESPDMETDKNDESLIIKNHEHGEKVDGDNEFVLNGITPTKTKDVTKIKGWKNKKFAIANKELNKPSDKLLFQLMNDNSEPTNQPKNSHNLDDKTEVQESSPIPSTSEKSENTNQAKSAFISDELDQYLTKNAELNISYEVPKLEAEQTITTKYIDIKFPELPKQNTQLTNNKNKHSYKPKTLAEKRKMLAEAEKPEIKDFLVRMNSKQRKSYEESVLSMRKKLIQEDVPFTRRCFMTSTSITNTHTFIVYNGKRLKVPSVGNKIIVAQIRDKRKVNKNIPSPLQVKVPRQRKPSLLSELKTEVNTFSFDPTEWEPIQVKLPKLTLEIKPRIGKRIHPKIEHFIKNDDIILNESRVEFALSTLKVNNSINKPKTFKFPLSYNNNQTHMTMYKRHPMIIDISSDIDKPIETDHEIAKTVSDVVNKMLDYIEISEETKNIVQDDNNPKNVVTTDVPEQPDSSPDKKWRKRKQRGNEEKSVYRTTLEMKRLNCKILSISLDEENNENDICTKECCKLGCVCKSIECSSANLLVGHCGLSRCMFHCKCKSKNIDVRDKFSLPVGTNIFSEGIINRLQDEAKKNLAKVEKEFTQTVIKTNNQIIVVGDSKERRRRATKMPKKYIDFVEEDLSDKTVSKYIAAKSKYRSITERIPTEQPIPFIDNTIITTDEENKDTLKDCFVKLLKYDFTGIMPFCLVHSLYKCHCKNKAVFDSSVGDKNIVACTYVNPPKLLFRAAEPVKNRLKPKTDRTFDKELYSSRTRGLATSYYLIRNKSLSHKLKIRKSAKRMQKELETYLRENAKKIIQGTSDGASSAEESKPANTVEVPKEQTEPKRKRKQSHTVLQDIGSDNSQISSLDHLDATQQYGNETERELKLQRRKAKSSTKRTGQELANISKTVGESAIKKLKNEFITLLGNKRSQLRLFPWAQLATRFQNGSFQIWYANIPKALLAITENGKRPSQQHYNIKLFQHVEHESALPSNIIRWLITKKIPLDKSVEDILIVLSFNKTYWEICGVCEKNKVNSKNKDHVSISLIPNWNLPENSSDTSTDTEGTLDVDDVDADKNSTENDQPIQSEMLVHDNIEEHKKVMYCSKRRYQPKKLMSDEIDDDSLKIRQVLWAPIPSVTIACKWRVMYMNIGFAYLSLSRSNYTIKYTDIIKTIKKAHNDKITIVLKSEELQKNYPHRSFGIYCVHNYTDKIFVGPYFINENYDMDTWSYVNGVLVNTSLLNQIKGKSVSSTGRWFHQATGNDDKKLDDDVIIVQEPAPVVDLTCESDEDSSSSSQKDNLNLDFEGSKDHSTLLKSMLLKPLADPDSEAEVVKAEQALDTLLKKGQLNVNKTLVQVDSLKPASRLDSPLQPAVNVHNTSPKNVAETPNIEECIDEQRLIIDEIARGSHLSEDETVDRNHVHSNKEGDDIQINRYLVTNIPGLGYISAYQHETTKIVDVVCPITKKMKQFSTPEAAIAGLERVFANKFIRVPTTFKLEFRMLEKSENTTDAPLDRSVLHGYHIVGAFGVRNLLRCTATELENFGLDKAQITHMWTLFEKKLLWAPLCQLGKLLAVPIRESAMELTLDNVLTTAVKEIGTLQKDSILFIKEKIDLESKKVMLAEKCSKLQYHLPPNQRNIAQQKLDQIINFSNRQTVLSNSASENLKPKTLEILEPIVLDDEDDVAPNNNKEPVMPSPSNTIAVTSPMKFTFRKGPVYKSTSLLSGKQYEIQNPSNQRSLLTRHLNSPSSQSDNSRLVTVQQKRNPSGSNKVDLNKCTFQIKPSYCEKKMLVKKVPIKVRKDILEVANNATSSSTSQLQTKSVLLHHGTLGNVIRTLPIHNSKTFFGNMPSISKPVKTHNAIANQHLVVTQSNSVNMSTGLPLSYIPVTMPSSISKSVGSLVKTNTMATLTPMPKSPELVLTNSTAKSTPNYIAIKEGDNLKYFQLVSETRSAQLQSVQSIKRPASSIQIQPPPLKKIAPAPSKLILTNQKTDKRKDLQ